MAETKTKPTDVDPAAYVAGLDNARRRADAEVLIQMMGEISSEPPVMWGPTMIGFGTLAYQYESGHGGVIFRQGFAPRAANTVLYINGRFEGRDALVARLGKIRTSVACIYVNKLADIDMAVLRELFERGWAESLLESPPP